MVLMLSRHKMEHLNSWKLLPQMNCSCVPKLLDHFPLISLRMYFSLSKLGRLSMWDLSFFLSVFLCFLNFLTFIWFFLTLSNFWSISSTISHLHICLSFQKLCLFSSPPHPSVYHTERRCVLFLPDAWFCLLAFTKLCIRCKSKILVLPNIYYTRQDCTWQKWLISA